MVSATGQRVPSTPLTCNDAGGTGGKTFDDTSLVSDGQVLTQFTLCSDERLDGIGYMIAPNRAVFHGSRRNCQVYDLESNEHITSYELHIANMNDPGSRRIGYIMLSSTKKHTFAAGRVQKQTDNSIVCSAPAGQRLGGFSGRAADEVDALTPIWKSL